MLRDDPGVSNRFVGSRIGQIYKTNWVEKSRIRIGGAVLQWARWIERQKYGEKLNDVAWMKDRIRNLTNSAADRLFAKAVIVDEETAAFRGRPKSLNAAATEAIRQLLDNGSFTQVALAKKGTVPPIDPASVSLAERSPLTLLMLKQGLSRGKQKASAGRFGRSRPFGTGPLILPQ